MMHEGEAIEGRLMSRVPARLKRISWPAVFAGVVVVLALQLFLSMIGLSVGAGVISPLKQRNPLEGIGTGAAIWFAVSTLIALFAGGWVAGRLAGIPRRLDSSLHGLLTWSVATLLTVYMVSTTAGSLLSGAGGVLGNTMSFLGKGVGAAASGLAEQGKEAISSSGLDLNELKSQAMALLQQTGKPDLQPGAMTANTDASANTGSTAQNAALNPEAAGADLTAVLNRLFNRGDQAAAPVDKEAAVNVIMARNHVSREQAQSTVDQWEQMYTQAKTKAAEAKVVAEQKAREVGDKASKALTKAAAWTAVMMLLGALAAAFGGFEAVPRDILITRVTRTGRLTTRPAGA